VVIDNADDTCETFYLIDKQLLQQVGPTGAVVHAILLANDNGDGPGLTHKQMAKSAGITHITARRTINKLRDEGLLKSEAQFQDNRQQANRYKIPTVATPALIEQPNSRYLSTDVENGYLGTDVEEVDNSSSKSGSSDLFIPLEVPGETSDLEPGEGLRPSTLVPGASEIEIQERQEKPKWGRIPQGTPMPMDRPGKFGNKNVFHVYAKARWLVSYFEVRVLEKANIDRKERGWKPQTTVGDKRLEPWLADALTFLVGRDAPDLSEVRLVVDWLFTKQSGILPFKVRGYQGRWGKFPDRKVTNIRKFADNYGQLLVSMHTGGLDVPVAEKSKPREFYNDGVGFPMEDKVIELVEIFAKTRLIGEVRDFDRYAWKKSFRIMLFRQEIPFEDIKMVVTALADRRLELDVERYFHAYYLHRDGEWQYVLGAVQRAMKREEMRREELRKARKPEPTNQESRAWEDWPRYRCDDDNDDNLSGAVNIADNVEERRRRYAARAARANR